MPKQTMPDFYVQTKFKPKATGQKREIKILNLGEPKYHTLGFKYMGDM